MNLKLVSILFVFAAATYGESSPQTKLEGLNANWLYNQLLEVSPLIMASTGLSGARANTLTCASTHTHQAGVQVSGFGCTAQYEQKSKTIQGDVAKGVYQVLAALANQSGIVPKRKFAEVTTFKFTISKLDCGASFDVMIPNPRPAKYGCTYESITGE